MLELFKRNIVELPFEVLAQAHWRPREVELNDKYKKRSAENLDEKEYQRLDKVWRKRETLVNFSLDALFLSLSPAELADFTNSLCDTDLDSAQLYGGHSREFKRIVGVPDFITGNNCACVLGEMKIQTVHGFSFDQFIKYQCFSILCRASANLPNNLLNLLIVPQNTPESFCSDYGKFWSPECRNRQLSFKENELPLLLADVRAGIKKLIKIPSVLKEKELCERLEVELLKDDSNLFAPTVVFSWNEFIEIFDDWATKNQRSDLLNASQSLLKMCLGSSKI